MNQQIIYFILAILSLIFALISGIKGRIFLCLFFFFMFWYLGNNNLDLNKLIYEGNYTRNK